MKPRMLARLARSIFFASIVVFFFFSVFIVLHSCKKSITAVEENEAVTGKKRPNPPPPVYFYFSNCTNPVINGNFVAGTPASATVTLNYINSPGGNYIAYTSTTVNGVQLSAPAGTLNTGSGSISFTASGTPVIPGTMTIPVSIGGSITCNLSITVLNAATTPGNCGDPGTAIGATGCITFNYRGQQFTYATVRAGDGKVWLRQNLGSPQVAVNSKDSASFGHYFQWGRWDDGHQVPTGPSVTGGPSLQNPSHIPNGNPNFIKGTTATTLWWGSGGAVTNTWSGTTITSTNGKDPCTALGAGWHLPSATEWINVMNAEAINDEFSAFESTLKLPLTGYRTSSNGALTPAFTTNFGHYWSNTAGSATAGNVFFIDTYNTFVYPATRGYGFSCRCVK